MDFEENNSEHLNSENFSTDSPNIRQLKYYHHMNNPHLNPEMLNRVRIK